MNAYNRIKASDFPLYKEKTLRVTPSLVRYALERRVNIDSNSAETSLIGMSFLTQSTRRECAIDVYSSYPKNESELTNHRSLLFQSRIAVPSLGNKAKVAYPSLDSSIYEREIGQGDFFFPIFIMHTHPGESTIISPQDTNGDGDMPALLSCYSSIYSLDNVRLRMTNPGIHVIAAQNGLGTSPLDTGFLFYQFTGDREAFDRFAQSYDAVRTSTREKHKQFIGLSHAERDYAFAKEMNQSRAFKAIYFPPANAFPMPKKTEPLYRVFANGHVCIDRKNIVRIAQKFAYEAKVTRVT